MHLILASTSPFRSALLKAAGLSFTCIKPDFDEFLDPSLAPDALALLLAEGKASVVASAHPDAIVIGADQVGEIEGVLLGKPHSPQEAREQLERLAGRTHRLVTGVVVIGAIEAAGARPTLRFAEETRITFRALDSQAIDAYVETGEWEGCAGAYRLEARGIQLVAAIDGDWHNIIGLPVLRVLEALRRLGLDALRPDNGQV